MYKTRFKVTLDEPLILSGNDKTEVALNCLDYIPGNIFLGIAARALYNEDKPEATLDLFHNGNVQFGNAYLSIDENQSKPIPAIWYTEKGKELHDQVYFYHQLTNDDFKKFVQEGKQIKQQREGYFVEKDGKIHILKADKGVVLKSAYESDRRSAKKEQMYMYEYLEAGQEFIFEVRATNETYLNEISKVLIGKRHISKSKSSEFGGITIAKISEVIPEETEPIKESENGSYIVYAMSNLAFLNKYGELTWEVCPEYLGFSNATINYEKSQLYFDKIHTRNGKRRTHDSDRLIIKKGSVIIIEKENNNKIEIDTEKITKGVGVFLSEGYGKICFNPNFTNDIIINFGKDDMDITHSDTDKYTSVIPDQRNDSLNNILCKRFESEERLIAIYQEVRVFINENKPLYSDIASSQWGAIRSYIYQARMDENPNQTIYRLIFDSTAGYIYHGEMGKKWEGRKRGKLKKFLGLMNDQDIDISNNMSDSNINKLLLLSIEFPKRINN